MMRWEWMVAVLLLAGAVACGTDELARYEAAPMRAAKAVVQSL